MTTLLFIFVVALCSALLLTPLVTKLAIHTNLVRQPTVRCVHTHAMPRIGGIAIYSSCFFAIFTSVFFQTDISNLILHETKLTVIFAAATLIFLVGLWDDLFSLSVLPKLSFQLIAAIITWYGGVQINVLSISISSGMQLDWLSLPVTVFWIVLVINAINLIDGLDGLAAGVTLFVSLLMLLICIIAQKYLIAIGFAALAGATLGFLRYNFNPASIFMGDSGSYFLGYCLASLSILGSVKGQTTLAILIPFLALGVPLFDALLAPLRRFCRGQKLFAPDQRHMHHRLVKFGLKQRNVVLLLYGITILLSIVAMLLVYARDEQAAFILLVPAVVCFFTFRKLGYINYLAVDKLYGWFRDLTDAAGISYERRSFLDSQLQIESSQSLDEMWELTGHILERFAFQKATLTLDTAFKVVESNTTFYWHGKHPSQTNDNTQLNEINKKYILKLSLPLVDRLNSTTFLGDLSLEKNIEQKAIDHYTMRRIEQLRRILINRISKNLKNSRDDNKSLNEVG